MHNQIPAVQIDTLLDIWAASLIELGGCPLFTPNDLSSIRKPPDYKHLYKAIDEIKLGDVKWERLSVWYTGEQPSADSDVPLWMTDDYTVYFCDPREVVQNILSHPSFKSELDLCPYCEFVTEMNEQRWSDCMSADWAWNQVVGEICIVHVDHV
jgi:hypothetical protein